MKNMDKVLLAVQMECGRQTRLAEISCFDKIAARVGISRQTLALYLNELQELGYLRYSIEHDFIYLTREGKVYAA